MKHLSISLGAGLTAGLLGLGLGVPTAATATATSSPALVGAGHRGVAFPAGWSWSKDHSRLTWTASAALPILDAAIQVQVDGNRLPGTTVARDGRSVTAPVTAPIKDPASLRVVAGGNRLDRKPAPASRPPVGGARAPKSGSASRPGPAPSGAVLQKVEDPGTPGPYRTQAGEYRLDDLHLSGWDGPVEMQALVVSPIGATGRRPVALFLHGRHATCYNRDADQNAEDSYDKVLAWPCAEGWNPVPSFRGFRQSQELLASQGWITVSIGANGISVQDAERFDNGAEGRSQLVRAHLSHWADWARGDAAWASAPPAVRSGPRPNLGKVLLVGHSRGGSGVNQAALDTVTGPAQPWQVRGLLLIAPASGGDPAPGVPTEVLMGACDGDISDLEGQSYIDESRDLTVDPALRAAVYVKGANHRYFNSEWSPGLAEAPAEDDWPLVPPGDEGGGTVTPDPDCSAQAPARLSAAEQLAVGATYTAAAAQALVLHRNGPALLMDGSGVRAATAGRAQVLSHALGGNRTSLLRPDAGTALTAGASVRAKLCETMDNESDDPDKCQDRAGNGYSPHFRDRVFGARPRKALAVAWDAPGGTVRASTAAVPLDPAATAVSLRILVPARARGTSFDVGLTDAAGHRLLLGPVTMDGLTGDVTSRRRFAWAQEVRLPINQKAVARAGLELSAVTGLEIAPRSSTGHLILLDAWSYRPGLDNAPPVTLPRFDLPANFTVDEGDQDHTLDVPIALTGRVVKPARITFSVFATSGRVKVPDLVVAPGATQPVLHVPVTGNTVANLLLGLRIQAQGMNEIVGGQSVLSVDIRDDDPPPAVTVTPSTTAIEGSSLTWTVSLSTPVAEELVAEITFVPPVDGTVELQAGDLPAFWLSDHDYHGPSDAPLSKADVNMFVTIPAGATTATIELPIAADDRADGPESVRLALHDEPYMTAMPADVVFEGTVTDS
jgi:hypothetical protein